MILKGVKIKKKNHQICIWWIQTFHGKIVRLYCIFFWILFHSTLWVPNKEICGNSPRKKISQIKVNDGWKIFPREKLIIKFNCYNWSAYNLQNEFDIKEWLKLFFYHKQKDKQMAGKWNVWITRWKGRKECTKAEVFDYVIMFKFVYIYKQSKQHIFQYLDLHFLQK